MLLPHQVEDLATLTLSKFERIKYTNISRDLQHLTVSKILKNKRVRIDGGKDIVFTLKVDNTGNARPTSLYDEDQTKVKPLSGQATVPWKMFTGNYSYSTAEESFQSAPETIVDQLKMKEVDALEDMWEMFETQVWQDSLSSGTGLDLWGIPTWIQKSTNTTPDFLGGNPWSGGIAGVDCNSEPNWRNWAGKYSTISTDDAVSKVKRAVRMTEFVSYVPQPELKHGDPRCELFTTEENIDAFERLAETRNDNLGTDLAKYMNSVMIAGCPVTWVPYLQENDSTHPIYGINWGYLRPYVHRGWNFKRTGPLRRDSQHNLRTVHIDCHMNMVCTNRRRQFVLSK